jgi:hypothetical protein
VQRALGETKLAGGYCRECGNQVKADTKFCPHCGVRTPGASDPLAAIDSTTRTNPSVREVRHGNRGEGLVPGVLACLFGILGIFSLGIVFVPLAALCSVAGMLLGLVGRSSSGFSISLIGGVLAITGVVLSPSLLLLVGGLVVASSTDRPPPTIASNPPLQRIAPASQEEPTLAKAQEQTVTATNECRAKRLSGELKTFVASAQCSNPVIRQAYRAANYRYMDLVDSLIANRLAVSEQIDRKQITEAQGQVESQRFFADLRAAEKMRDGKDSAQ